jgi:hypothetical protein
VVVVVMMVENDKGEMACSGSVIGSTLLFNLSTTKQLRHSTRCIASAV